MAKYKCADIHKGGLGMAVEIEIKSGDLLSLDCFNNHLKISAGPGAGKTHFLVENIKNIVNNHPSIAKSNFKKVVCITYTNAAVLEIKRRLRHYTKAVEVNTIHGFIIEHIIKPFQQDIKQIINEVFSISIAKSAKLTSEIEGLGILHGIDKEEIYSYIKERTKEPAELKYGKKTMGEVEIDNDLYLETGEIKLSAGRSILEEHRIHIKSYVWTKVRKLTHNEILFFGYEILKRNPVALYSMRVKFPFIFVDEFQDTNPLQVKMLQLIGEKATTVGVIGDIAQSIYSFQGARPSQFENFSIGGNKELGKYFIKGNRRSTCNIVNFCNFLRSSDTLVQESIRQYSDTSQKDFSESIKVHFLLGESDAIKQTISNIVSDGGVVLTRTWPAAFSFIENISTDQKDILKRIYNSYYNTSIDIRSEIVEMNNVRWVRAFKFIFLFWDAYRTGSFIDIIRAFELYVSTNIREAFSAKIIFQIKQISNELFHDLTPECLTKDIIDKFNSLIMKNDYSDVKEKILGEDFQIKIFSELDKDGFVEMLSKLNWDTSNKLFTEVFTSDSKYLTVHQAKGLEWEKVVVSVDPSRRNDKTTLTEMFANPHILNETPEDEFTRIYYVACSRAIEHLYVHIPAEAITQEQLVVILNKCKETAAQNFEYEIIN